MNPNLPDPMPIPLPTFERRELAFNIYDHLLAKRTIFLRGELTDETANEIIAQLLFLDAEDSERDIFFLINSSGGSVTATLALYDTIQQIYSNVCTVCVGTAASMAAILLSSGTKGKRSALLNARMKIQQPSGTVEGKATEFEIVAQEILFQKETINRILAQNTGRSQELIEYDTQRDFFLNAKEAKAYGLIDEIVSKSPVSA